MKLRDICYINSGGTPSRSNLKFYQGTIPWAKISDIENAKKGIILDTVEKISADGLKSIRNKIFPKGTLLFAMYGSIGKMAFAGKELSTNQAILGIRPKNEKQLHLQYLKIWLERNKQKLINQGRGVALKNLSATMIRNIDIDLPPIDDQIRIATILSRAEAMIAKRKESIRLLDDLVRSVFLEMFGDPLRNEKEWNLKRLGNSIKIKHGYAFKSEFFFENGKYILLTPGNFFENGGYKNRGDKQKYYIGEIPSEYILNKGDLLIAMTEQAPGLLGSPIIVPESNQFLHNQRLGLVVFNKEYFCSHFLFHLFNSKKIKDMIHKKATGLKVRHTSPKKIEALMVYSPPLPLQTKFAQIVEKVESIKSRYEASLSELENLYGSLTQRAFKGELDLSGIPIVKRILIQDRITLSDVVEAKVIKKSTQFSQKAFKEWIKETFETAFSFETLMAELENAAFKPMPEYGQIKTRVFKLLEGEPPMLSQAFDMDKKEIMLTVNP